MYLKRGERREMKRGDEEGRRDMKADERVDKG
jgi:hypothetical protein